jgi:hypothetical protein
MLQHPISIHPENTENISAYNIFGTFNQHNISISNIECLKPKKQVSFNEDNNSTTEDSVSTKDSDEQLDVLSNKKSNISQKKSYKKAPQGKMDESDEELLLTFASKYKHDWKKVSKKIFKINKKKLGPNLLRIRYKELAPDLTQKRVRFTHKEDLMIVKYYSQYGYDWEKIAAQFESRTAIMVKNRFYHIKKKNILEKLLEEVDTLESSSISVDTLAEESPKALTITTTTTAISSPVVEIMEREDVETVQFFVQKGEDVFAKTVKFSPIDMHFGDRCFDSLCDTVTPVYFHSEYTDYREHRFEEDNVFSLTNFYGNQRRFY